MVTYTSTYNLKLPVVGQDDDAWGGYINDNTNALENLLTGNTAITSLVITTADINGGTLDNVVIGGSTAAAITGTTITGTSFVSSGNVGIGSSTANHFSTAGTANVLGVKSTSGGLISIAATGTNFSGIDLGTDAIRRGGMYSLNGSHLTFYTNGSNSGTTLTERMRIDNSGKVGIGTTAPANLFVVAEGTNQHGIELAPGTLSYIQAYDRATSDYGDLKIDAQTIAFGTDNGVTKMTLDASGNVTVTGSLAVDDITIDGSTISDAGDLIVDVGGNLHLDAAGHNITFKDAGTEFGKIAKNGDNLELQATANLSLRPNGGTSHQTNSIVWAQANIKPWQDDYFDLGSASYRWDDIYATNGTIQTSDRNEKQDIAELTDAEQRVAVAAKGLLRKFRWKTAVAEKGDEARTHFGIIAQDLQAAFAAEGLDAGDYAMFISSTWTDEETGEERTRMGVRYSELLAFIIAAI